MQLVNPRAGDERATVRGALGELFDERAGASGCAALTNPIHIGVATKP